MMYRVVIEGWVNGTKKSHVEYIDAVDAVDAQWKALERMIDKYTTFQLERYPSVTIVTS